jgi:hypothetical protein
MHAVSSGDTVCNQTVAIRLDDTLEMLHNLLVEGKESLVEFNRAQCSLNFGVCVWMFQADMNGARMNKQSFTVARAKNKYAAFKNLILCF